jgi:hypothetical protein
MRIGEGVTLTVDTLQKPNAIRLIDHFMRMDLQLTKVLHSKLSIHCVWRTCRFAGGSSAESISASPDRRPTVFRNALRASSDRIAIAVVRSTCRTSVRCRPVRLSVSTTRNRYEQGHTLQSSLSTGKGWLRRSYKDASAPSPKAGASPERSSGASPAT